MFQTTIGIYNDPFNWFVPSFNLILNSYAANYNHRELTLL